MKRFYCLILCLILSVNFNVTALAADSTESSTTIEVLEDGSYIEITTETTSSTISTSCPSSSWKLSNKSASRSGATATASAVARRYKNGSVAQTLKPSVSLTCSKTGKLY